MAYEVGLPTCISSELLGFLELRWIMIDRENRRMGFVRLALGPTDRPNEIISVL